MNIIKKWINKKLLLYDNEKHGPAITFLSLPFFTSNFFSVLSQHCSYDSWKLSTDGGPCKAKSSNLFTYIHKMCWATLKRLIGIWNCELWSWFAMNVGKFGAILWYILDQCNYWNGTSGSHFKFCWQKRSAKGFLKHQSKYVIIKWW